MKIGMIGTGAIGTFLLEKINKEMVIPGAHISAIFDERRKSTLTLETLSNKYNTNRYNDLESFLSSSINIVVECANIQVVKKYAGKIIREKDLFLISVGALADMNLTKNLQMLTKQHERKIYLPSGAIGGLDILRAANVLNGIETVKLTTRKPSHALGHENLEKAKTIFQGSAQEAIDNFPKNANIAVIISLAGIGVDQTKVEIIADPMIQKNVHQLRAAGDFGKLTLELENNASPTNPKTSYLTALSILSSLKSLDQTIVIG